MNRHVKIKKTVIKQLDKRLNRERSVLTSAPKEGWIRTLRKALGMTLDDLAKRIGISKQVVANLELSEKKGTISMATLRKVAEAMNCELHVSLVPRQSLEKMIREQALRKAQALVNRTELHMNLEAQGTDQKFRNIQIKEIAEDLMQNPRRGFWEDS